jgi:periplasmic protein TonB
MPTSANPYAQPRQSTAPALNRTGRTFALVLLLHAGVFFVLHSVMQLSVPAKLVETISAHIVTELKPPELAKLLPPPPTTLPPPPAQPKTQNLPTLQPAPPVPSTAPIPLAQAPSAAPAITAAPAVAVPAQNVPSTINAAAPVQIKKTVPATAVNGSCQVPRYPAISQRLQEEGLVKLLLHISETGKVIESSVKESSGYKRLDAAALAALSLCTYKPGTVDGKPQASWITQPYRWNIVNE